MTPGALGEHIGVWNKRELRETITQQLLGDRGGIQRLRGRDDFEQIVAVGRQSRPRALESPM